MFSPTGYVAEFPNANMGLGLTLPVYRVDERNSPWVLDTNGTAYPAKVLSEVYGELVVRPLRGSDR